MAPRTGFHSLPYLLLREIYRERDNAILRLLLLRAIKFFEDLIDAENHPRSPSPAETLPPDAECFCAECQELQRLYRPFLYREYEEELPASD